MPRLMWAIIITKKKRNVRYNQFIVRKMVVVGVILLILARSVCFASSFRMFFSRSQFFKYIVNPVYVIIPDCCCPLIVVKRRQDIMEMICRSVTWDNGGVFFQYKSVSQKYFSICSVHLDSNVAATKTRSVILKHKAMHFQCIQGVRCVLWKRLWFLFIFGILIYSPELPSPQKRKTITGGFQEQIRVRQSFDLDGIRFFAPSRGLD